MTTNPTITIGSVTIKSPSSEDIRQYSVGSSVTTPTGHVIVQPMFSGIKVVLTWDGLSEGEFSLLKNELDARGHFEVNVTLTDGVVRKMIYDGMDGISYKKRYNTLLKKERYEVSVSLKEIP
jgi:hypothetical protein